MEKNDVRCSEEADSFSEESVPHKVWRSSVFTRIYTQLLWDDTSAYQIETRWGAEITATVNRACPDSLTYQIKTRLLFLCFPGVLALVLFGIWFLGLASELTPRARIDLSSAALWMLLSPVLMGYTEYRLAGLLLQFRKDDLNSNSKNEGWNLDQYITRLPIMNTLYWIITSLTALIFVVSFIIFNDFIANILQINEISTSMQIVGSICMAITGFATGNGIWGLWKACKLYYHINKYAKIDWYPFRVKQILGLEQLSKDGFITALVFSVGGSFAPISLRIYSESESILKYIALIGVIVLIFGSAVLFVFISIIIYRLGKSARENVLESLANEIEYYLLHNSMEYITDAISSDLQDKPKMELRELLMLQNSIYTAETHSVIVRNLRYFFLVLFIPISLAFFPQVIGLLIN